MGARKNREKRGKGVGSHQPWMAMGASNPVPVMADKGRGNSDWHPASSSAVAAAASSSWAAAVAEYPVPSEEALAGAGAMLRRAEASGRMGANIGSLEFVAFCSIHKRRLMMLMPDGEIDIAMAFAATLLDETWTLVPFARLVVPVARGGGHWCMCSYGEATHFMAAVPAERRHVEGVSAFAEGHGRATTY